MGIEKEQLDLGELIEFPDVPQSFLPLGRVGTKHIEVSVEYVQQLWENYGRQVDPNAVPLVPPGGQLYLFTEVSEQ